MVFEGLSWAPLRKKKNQLDNAIVTQLQGQLTAKGAWFGGERRECGNPAEGCISGGRYRRGRFPCLAGEEYLVEAKRWEGRSKKTPPGKGAAGRAPAGSPRTMDMTQ